MLSVGLSIGGHIVHYTTKISAVALNYLYYW